MVPEGGKHVAQESSSDEGRREGDAEVEELVPPELCFGKCEEMCYLVVVVFLRCMPRLLLPWACGEVEFPRSSLTLTAIFLLTQV